MKKCFKCGIEKPLVDFYKHKKMADGFLNKCKICTQLDVKNTYLIKKENSDFMEAQRDRCRQKYYRLGQKKPKKENRQKANCKHKLNFPEKYRVKCLSQRLTKVDANNHLHHWSYNIEHARDVIELAPDRHAFIHRFLIYDQEYYMYRDMKNNLLDTKEKHTDYINSL